VVAGETVRLHLLAPNSDLYENGTEPVLSTRIAYLGVLLIVYATIYDIANGVSAPQSARATWYDILLLDRRNLVLNDNA
jgi:hypothetical protein